MNCIIFYIIIIVAIVKISKNNQNKNATSQNQGAGTKISSAPTRTNTVTPTNTTRITPTPTRPSTQNQARPQPQQKKTAVNTQGSTTEMLRKKAEEDQANHDKEKKLAEYKQKKSHMGKRYAQRYMLGDPVPKNMRIKCCGYCGAENLITYGNREQLLCYFCREDLK